MRLPPPGAGVVRKDRVVGRRIRVEVGHMRRNMLVAARRLAARGIEQGRVICLGRSRAKACRPELVLSRV